MNILIKVALAMTLGGLAGYLLPGPSGWVLSFLIGVLIGLL